MLLTLLPGDEYDGDLDGDNDIDIADFDLAFAQWGLELSVVS